MPTEDVVRRVYTNLLSQAPPGEFNAVFDDVRNLHEHPALLDEQTETTLTTYNHANFLPVQSPELPRPTVLSVYNVVNQAEQLYLEPNSNLTFNWDPIKRVVTSTHKSTLSFDPELVAWRDAVQKELDLYIDDHFHKNGVGSVFIHEGKLVLVISSHKYMRRNYYAGRWISNWSIPAYKKTTQVTVEGHANVLNHYYEEGNVQMNSSKDFVLNVAYAAEITAAAKEVLKSICEAESAWEANLHEKFTNFSETTFKLLRRALPVTRTKMDWVKAHAYRMTKDINDPKSSQ
uniref:F-actin-capping protein subunit alpha n=1 Tax=Panagrellus redivivus TaxID=6233 RepID=A0A7E4VXI1_PANRE